MNWNPSTGAASASGKPLCKAALLCPAHIENWTCLPLVHVPPLFVPQTVCVHEFVVHTNAEDCAGTLVKIALVVVASPFVLLSGWSQLRVYGSSKL